jgi:hypothetical protein
MDVKKYLKENPGKLRALLVTLTSVVMVGAVSADSYFTCITILVQDLASNLMPAFVNLVIAAAPVLIVLAIKSPLAIVA